MTLGFLWTVFLRSSYGLHTFFRSKKKSLKLVINCLPVPLRVPLRARSDWSDWSDLPTFTVAVDWTGLRHWHHPCEKTRKTRARPGEYKGTGT